MKISSLFKGLGNHSHRDRHVNSTKVRIFKGDYKALKLVAKSRQMTIIQLLHQAVVMVCSAAIYGDIMKHEQRKKLVIALCQGAGIQSKSLDKFIPKQESPGGNPAAPGQ